MSRAMIVSVGGSSAPVVHTLVRHSPAFVCFFCSEGSVETLGDVKRQAGEQGVTLRNRNVVVRDPEDLVACYRDALDAAARIEEAGFGPADVVVDYTGGTKTMSAALTLATVGKGYRFSYVAGRERDKGGLGAVVAGSEEVRSGVSPWRLFAVEEKRSFSALFNRHLFASAAEVLERTAGHDLPEKPLLTALVGMTHGYRHWDAFRHGEAKKHLKEGVAGLGAWVELRGERALEEPLERARGNLEFLERMQAETKGFQMRHRLQVVDLLANARRRTEVGRYDDAVARVYRALELVAQIAFRKAFGCETGEAAPDRLPEELRAELGARYGGSGAALQLPLFAAFRALAAAGRDEGRAFTARKEEFQKILYARNHSILAHGSVPVDSELPPRFEGLVREAFAVAETVEFPSFDL